MDSVNNNIEVEIRAEVPSSDFANLFEKLKKSAKFLSHTKRVSVIFLGKVKGEYLDFRVRIDSERKAELVLKKGDFHAQDRIEVSQKINDDQFIGFVKILSLLELKSKVTERENFIFDLGDGITLVLVKAHTIAYIEIEKMSNEYTAKKNKDELKRVLNKLGLKIIKNSKEFNNLCDRLTKLSDWVFVNTKDNIGRLTEMIDHC